MKTVLSLCVLLGFAATAGATITCARPGGDPAPAPNGTYTGTVQPGASGTFVLKGTLVIHFGDGDSNPVPCTLVIPANDPSLSDAERSALEHAIGQGDSNNSVEIGGDPPGTPAVRGVSLG